MRLKRSLYPETKVQVAIVKYIKLQHPAACKLIVRIGNEGKRTVQGHELAKKCGMNVGASDLLIAYPSSGFHGLWLEIKQGEWKPVPSNKKHTEKQLRFIERVKSVGYQGAVGVGIDQCIEIVDNYFNSTHGNP